MNDWLKDRPSCTTSYSRTHLGSLLSFKMAANMSAMERGDRISSETGERAASPRRVVGIQPAIAASRLDSKVSDDEAPLSDALSDDDEDTPRERESFIKRTAADASTGSSSAKMKSALHANATRLRWYQLAFLSTYWFGWSFLWLPLFVVIIPKQVRLSSVCTGRCYSITLPRIPVYGAHSVVESCPVLSGGRDRW